MIKGTCLLTVFWLILCGVFCCFAADDSLLRQGIRQYEDENFEEAVDVLKKAREQNPDAAVTAFFLGMAYKQVMNYPEAAANLRDAVTQGTKIRDALVELIDVLMIMGGPEHLKEAEEWISEAEERKIASAKIAFLKGGHLNKTGKPEEAAAAFEDVKQLDPSLAPEADFQIALIRYGKGDLERADADFRRAASHDADSDIARLSRSYLEQIERRRRGENPLRVKIALFGQYDSNMVLKPTLDIAAEGITDEESWVGTAAASVDYIPRLPGGWLLNAQYSLYTSFHENHEDTHDVIANSIALIPGYDFGPFSLHFMGYYSNFLLGNPDYNRYLDYFTVGPLARFPVSDRHLFEAFAGYGKKHFFDAPEIPEEERDADGFRGFVSWTWRFSDSLIFDLQYDYLREDAEGANWENDGHRFSAGVFIPFADRFSLDLRVDEFLQYFDNYHPLLDSEEREDHTNMATAELAWNFTEPADLILKYTRTRANSNVGIYDYKRHLVSLGVEYRF